ncbi:MAG: sensor histidine kinase [Desulfuromonadaceae bacterium]
MKLDTATIVVISIITDFILVLILLHTWRTRTTYPGFTVWIAATACWSVGSVLSLMLPTLQPQFIPKIIGNGLIMLHPLLLFEGISLFHGLRRRWWGTPLNSLLILSGLLCLSYFLYISDNIIARIIGINIVLAILFARTSIEPLLQARCRRYSIQWLLSLCLLPLVALLVARCGHYFSQTTALTVADALAHESLLRWLMLYGIIVELIIAYSYLSMTSDRVEEELRHSENSYRELTDTLQTRIEEETKQRISQERLLANHSRLAAMGEMISAIAHQWRQPLSTLGMIVQRTHAMGTMNELTPDYLGEFKANSMRQIKYMSETIEEFRGFYRPEKTKEPFSPYGCISDSIRLFDPQFTSSGIEVSVACQGCDNQLAHGYPNEFKQVILNLLGNARDAILASREASSEPEKGLIRVAIDATANQGMTIDVSDNGCGIAGDVALNIFDPYFTTKEESGGTGIGLYMSRMIVEDSLGGRLMLLSNQDPTTFRIELSMETPA